ncbi:CsgG/HfaB family protein [Celeribacter marinus]|uniref:CsgG/HfaB family protein n=1 Tax=Celeribacter marinus TaxID=1397108 RepID=UPI0031808B42
MLKSALSLALLGAVSLSGCTGAEFQKIDAPFEEKPEMRGPLAVSIDTVYDEPLSCLQNALPSRSNYVHFAVGKVTDYTGQNIDSERPVVSQGASLMAISALGKLGLRQVERYDTSVTELELRYAGQKLLSYGSPAANSPDASSGEKLAYAVVPAGILRASDYTVVGGITELDFNTYSTAFDFRAGPVGRLDRLFAVSVALDLRLVNTKTLEVVDTVSIRKQVYGRENQTSAYFNVVPLDDARFEASKRERVQEPIQRSIRIVMERAMIDLVSNLFDTDASACLSLAALPEIKLGAPKT